MDATVREDIIRAVADTARHCGASKAILFGSHARGTATRRSDVDAVFIAETTARFTDRLGPYMAGIYERTGIPAEVFVYTPREFDQMQSGAFMKRILREGITVYER